jgi:hypothetical protein
MANAPGEVGELLAERKLGGRYALDRQMPLVHREHAVSRPNPAREGRPKSPTAGSVRVVEPT